MREGRVVKEKSCGSDGGVRSVWSHMGTEPASDMARLAQHELILHSLKSEYRAWRCVSTNAFIARFPRLSHMKMLLRPHLAFRNMVWIGFSS